MFQTKIFALLAAASVPLHAEDLRIGIIGTDTSHVVAFTKVLNDPANKDHIPGAKVVAAFKGGSPDIESSASRVEGYAAELAKDWKVEMVPTIGDLCSKVDAILLESNDGRKHLDQAKQALACKKPMFIDKPLASTLADALAIAKAAKDAGVPWFSSSSLRWADIVTTMKFDDMKSVVTWGPAAFEVHHELDLSRYGIHPVEMLYAMMGPGCVDVSRVVTFNNDTITCRWNNHKQGTVIGMRPGGAYGALVVREKTVAHSPDKVATSYVPMLREIVKFFQTGKPPVPNNVTLEIMAFMDAAQRSKMAGGKPMKLANFRVQ